VLKYSQSQSEEETERHAGLSVDCSVRQLRAGAVTSRPFPSDGTMGSEHRRFEEVSSTIDELMFVKMLVAGIELIELRS
jgi:hypothetical protein